MKFSNLLDKNKAVEPKTYDAVYGSLVENNLKAKGYSPSKIQAIVNNYLDEPDNPKYIQEFSDLQKARKQSKAEAKKDLEVND